MKSGVSKERFADLINFCEFNTPWLDLGIRLRQGTETLTTTGPCYDRLWWWWWGRW